ncbi:MAG: patatin-like phospholipase family protein [Aeromicrobium sp.]|nr:patatin-like phospholipase family protein [Burkholderiales bacterium]
MNRRRFLGSIALLPALTEANQSREGLVAGMPSKGKQHARSKQIGVAFGGGSMHGMVHIGVLKAFVEKRLDYRLISGTSVGAIVGALTAAKMPFAEIDHFARQVEWPGVTSLSWSGRGLLQHNKLRALIDKALGGRALEALPIPFGAVATDVMSGERVLIRTGPAAAAISASCSVPVLFEPVRINGRDLVDGGLTEPVPVIALREMGADLVIGVDVAFRPGEESFQGFTGAAFQTMHIMANALTNLQIKRADVAIRMNVHHLIGKQFGNEQLIAAGYAAAMAAWPEITAKLSA